MENKPINKQIKRSSILTVPIIDTKYKIKNLTTICIIRWLNPASGNIQVTRGIATCNPGDVFDEIVGKRLSESRAKMSLYRKYTAELGVLCEQALKKHFDLAYGEAYHQLTIKPMKGKKSDVVK